MKDSKMNTHKKINKMLTAYVLGELSPAQTWGVMTSHKEEGILDKICWELASIVLVNVAIHERLVKEESIHI
jgi:hypothetical protein